MDCETYLGIMDAWEYMDTLPKSPDQGGTPLSVVETKEPIVPNTEEKSKSYW